MVFASASLQAQSTEQRCSQTPIDSTNPSSPVYEACHVDRRAKLRSTGLRPSFTPAVEVASPTCYRASFEFVVDTSGQPELATVRKVSSTDPEYAGAVEATIGGFRFEAARLDNTPVRQVTRYESRMGITQAVATGSQAGAGNRSRRPNC
ncbi:hypothetical protein [Gemmatimonas sp.]|uniref:hypothetical protein n=1 Tax=Gemmatimonas sp. TaxID=1962908 RepID=UPI0035635F96